MTEETGVPIILISRSAWEERQKCRRAFYWRYLYKRGGFQEARTPFHLAFGIAVHSGMEHLIRTAILSPDWTESIDVGEAIAAAEVSWGEQRPGGSYPPKEPPQVEVLALLTALILGWTRVEAPRFFDEYEVVKVEQEGRPQPLSSSAALQFRADVVVRSRYTGLLRVINWKTTSGWKDWTDEWSSDVQRFTEAWALERESGERVEGTVMAGLHKGSFRQTGGEVHFSSPLIWAYKREVNGQMVYSADTKAPKADALGSWSKFKVWEETFRFLDAEGETYEAHGVEAWVNWLPAHVVAASFLTSEVLVGHPKTVAAFIESAGREARDDHHLLTEGVSESDRLAHFGPKFGKWTCGTVLEPKCAYYKACHTDASIDDMIESGELVPRKDHHAKEPTSA